MRQARLILVTGLPGTGKSTLAREVAARYRVPLICKDTVKEPLLDVMGARDRADSRRLSDASFAVMFSLARECLSVGTDLVLEGNFRPGEHERAVSAAVTHASDVNPQIAQVLCHTSEPVRIARLKARATDPSRHAGHRDAGLAANAAGQAFTFLSLPGERLVFDSDAQSRSDVDTEQIKALLQRLGRWYL